MPDKIYNIRLAPLIVCQLQVVYNSYLNITLLVSRYNRSVFKHDYYIRHDNLYNYITGC
jgi:hypothetical protein